MPAILRRHVGVQSREEMICWLIIRSEETRQILESHPFNSTEEAERHFLLLQERWSIAIRKEILWLLPGEVPL
jgi:hypothetical protein